VSAVSFRLLFFLRYRMGVRDSVGAPVRVHVQISTYLNLYFDSGFLSRCFGFLLYGCVLFGFDLIARHEHV
jgi:hypothetical protein